ncbi:hypothetical protein TRIP_B200661 [uncultured Desulfatiglans sp.]|nr:hypothetical protein TRIP_B200661 [uncultured Desulfatiglans sp.]
MKRLLKVFTLLELWHDKCFFLSGNGLSNLGVNRHLGLCGGLQAVSATT